MSNRDHDGGRLRDIPVAGGLDSTERYARLQRAMVTASSFAMADLSFDDMIAGYGVVFSVCSVARLCGCCLPTWLELLQMMGINVIVVVGGRC
jgi:hypothetical protein